MTPLLERDSQLAALLSYATEAGHGSGRLALIAGEAGIGKSSLVERLEQALPDAVWWWGACDGLSTPRPLGPLTDIASQAGGALHAVCVANASRDERFDALLDAVRRADRLCVIVIEDIHWADVATLDMVRYLGRRIRDLAVLVLITYRDDALTPDEPLRVTIGDLATHRTTRRVTLGPLSRNAVELLAAGSALDVDEIYRLSGGSPFFVTEVLAAASTEIPRSAREVVLARAAGLSARSRAVLDCAALIGSHITPSLLSTASAASPKNIDDLISSGLLVRDGNLLRFRHEIARYAVRDEIAPHNAVELHHAILAALLGANCSDDALLAFHADAAGDTVRVLEHAPPAGRAAAALASHREAAAQFERAIRHADNADVETRATLYDDLAAELSLVERWDDAVDVCGKAIALWREAGNALREGATETRLLIVMWRLCRGTEVVAASRRARELLEPLGDTEELAALYLSGAAEPDRVTYYIGRAVEIARELDRPQLHISALNGAAYLAAGRGGDYEAPLTQALQLALDHGLQRQAGMCYANLTEYYATEFRLIEKEAFFRTALDYCEEHDVATFGNCVRGHYSMALMDHCRWDDALRQARQVLAQPASPINRLSSLVTTGLILARRDDPRSTEFLAEADAVATGVDEPLYLAWAGLPIAEAAWLRGDEDAARDRLRQLRLRLTEFEPWWLAAVIAWEHRLGVPPESEPALAPYAAQVAGPPRHAAEVWDALHMPYHAALALGDSDDEADLRDAVGRLDPVSPPAARIVRRRMRDLGLRAIPAGARASTRSDPQGLTRREREILELLGENLTNDQIAERLVISARTVDHHVSAVLAKLGVASRRDASALAST